MVNLPTFHQKFQGPKMEVEHLGDFMVNGGKYIIQYMGLIVDWWFWCWFGFLGSPYEQDCYCEGTPRIPDHHLPLVE